MRLIRIHADNSLSFVEFFDEEVPKYVILSHRWGSNETTYKDFKNGRGHQTTKLTGCAEQARRDGHEHMWIDTCCMQAFRLMSSYQTGSIDVNRQLTVKLGINKSSSTELTEAINSMYSWYAKSEVCYAYLNDVHGRDFSQSKWYERGWTLQELIAPQKVHFFDADWQAIGTKHERLEELQRLTWITTNALEGWSPLQHSVAERMHWASRRVTTRIEDEAYCLMGIFDVNMPLLYGEGRKAFRRLQEEIIRQTADHSLLAWSSDSDNIYQPLLAPSPRAFTNAQGMLHHPQFRAPVVENTLVRMDVLLLPFEGQSGVFEAVLGSLTSDSYSSVSILLLEWNRDFPGEGRQVIGRCFIRVRADLLNLRRTRILSADLEKIESVSILAVLPRGIYTPRPELGIEVYVWGLKAVDTVIKGLRMPTLINLDESSTTFLITATRGIAAALLYDLDRDKKIMVIGLNSYGRPWCQLADAKGQSLEEALEEFTHDVDDKWPSTIADNTITIDTTLVYTAGRFSLCFVTEASSPKSRVKRNRLRFAERTNSTTADSLGDGLGDC